MEKEVLNISATGQKIIDSYLNMSIAGKVITCPYYTNLKKERAALKVFLGKGSAQEIINETKFLSQKENIDLARFSEERLYRFMVENNLGIDCSGLTIHILKAAYKEKSINLFKKIKVVSFLKNPWRWLVSQLRPIENISVRILADGKNSFLLKSLNDALPNDLLIRTNLRHVYLITKTEKENGIIKKISFVHAPRPKRPDYFGPGIFQKTVILKNNSLKELGEKINDEVIVKRLKF
ncbi:MAG: hypothetical protein PHW15_03385 [Patescibacteria group bacterium]|jgi:hypothetical protein|nr:hypothetical protein [Patescibacteria group bacterium]MDD5173031.1 hypothetical protein [Patescibacteria group bacterium]